MNQDKKQKKLVFIMPNIRHTGALKRVESFIDHGYKVKIYGYDRGFGKRLEHLKGVEIHCLGTQENGKSYLRKFWKAFKELQEVFRKEEKALFYVFSFDLALIIALFHKKYVYEIRDLVYGYFPSRLLRWGFKLLDKWIIRKSQLSVVLSEGFSKYLYGEQQHPKLILQPNKIHASFSAQQRPQEMKKWNPNQLVFSFIGAYRFPNTLMRFARIIGEHFPNHQFLFFGDGANEHKEAVALLAQNYANIQNFGPFRNPQDLSEIYQQIDITLSCYDANFLNVRLAEPNKLYEAAYFLTPLLVSKHTFLSERVAQMKLGWAIEADSDQEIITFIKSLDLANLESIQKEMLSIPTADILDDASLKIRCAIDKMV